MTVVAWTFTPDAGRAAKLGATAVSLDELLDRSDVVSLHLRVSDATRHLVNQDRLMRMRKGAYLVNTARAALVEREALIAALADGHLGGAGLDVFHQEPLPKDDPLTRFSNVIFRSSS